jgi:hypothetical protein
MPRSIENYLLLMSSTVDHPAFVVLRMNFKQENGEDHIEIRIKYLDKTFEMKQPIENKRINIPFTEDLKGCDTDRNPGLRILYGSV